ncbi:MAG: hypothetical protein PHG73_06680 [Pygmaiobacter sp.]|nr:hypothetical protein [Pygmaiobacter sp.]
MKKRMLFGITSLTGFALLFAIWKYLQDFAEKQVEATYNYWPVVLVPVLLSFLLAAYLRTIGSHEFWKWLWEKKEKKVTFSVENVIVAAIILLFMVLNLNSFLTFTGDYSNLLALLLFWYFLLGGICFDPTDTH